MDSNEKKSIPLDLYQLVTDQIISLLEKGIIPWQQPWTEAGPPMNLLSRRHYRGINYWLLLSLNYERNLFLTWEQIKSVGGSVLKGEVGHIVVFWKPVQKKSEEETEQKQKSVPMLRYYKVFNITQCKDIPEHLLPTAGPALEFEPVNTCEEIINGMPDAPKIVHKEQKAYYRIDTDIINMPKRKTFKSVESYYSILFHELTHSTGAEKRLARTTLTEMVPFGTESYAIEELIAEMGSAYLCHISGILPFEISNKAAYLDNWLKVLKGDKKFIILASGQAQKAVNYILNIIENESSEKERTSLNKAHD